MRNSDLLTPAVSNGNTSNGIKEQTPSDTTRQSSNDQEVNQCDSIKYNGEKSKHKSDETVSGSSNGLIKEQNGDDKQMKNSDEKST